MKLYYITRVSIPSNAAQSLQIVSMCKVFNKFKDFKLISPKTDVNKSINKDFNWDKINLNSNFKYLEFVLKSLIRVLQEKPTHIFTRDIVVAFVLSFFGVRVAYEAHKEPKNKVSSFMLSFLKNKKNFFLITISKALKKYYIESYKYDNSKILACHDGVFLEKYDKLRNIKKSDLRKKLNLPLDKKIVVHTGSLYKGDDAKLFKYVVKNFKEILFVHIGGSIDDIKKYEEYYKKYFNIIFVGHQESEQVIEYQMSADLLFYALTKKNSLWWCTSPLKIFEYMATGVPILCSNIGSVSEVLNGINSIPYDPESENTIVEGVQNFLKNPNSSRKKADNALLLVSTKYTWHHRANKIIDFIRR